MPTAAFVEARRRGKIGQGIIAGKLRQKGWTVEITADGYNPDYDLQAYKDQMAFRAEVKYDQKVKEYGNVAVEISSLKKSKASMLFYVVDDTPIKTYMMPLQDMVTFASNWPIKKTGGEFRVELAIIPYNDFKALPFIQELK